jgi:hypothetical protein
MDEVVEKWVIKIVKPGDINFNSSLYVGFKVTN